MKNYYPIIFALFFLPYRLDGQIYTAAVSDFQKAVEHYRSGHYSECRVILEPLVSDYSDSTLQKAAGLLLAGAYLKEGLYYKSEKLCRRLAPGLSGTESALSVQWMLAQALYHQQKKRQCYELLMNIRKQARLTGDLRMADSMMGQILRHALNVEEVVALAREMPEEESATVWTELAFRYESLERIHKARQAAAIALHLPLSGFQRRHVMALQERIRVRPEGPVHIGLITSLTGGDSDLGIPLLEGIELALKEHNAAYEPKIILHALDGHSDLITVIRKTRELIASDQLSLLIGPPDGYQMIAVAAEASRSGIPVLSPNVTLNRLTELGENIYQANCDRQTRFELLTKHVVKNKGLKTFAALAPSDDYGDDALKSFIQTVQSLGGKIITVERYYEGTTDFRNQLMRIRKLGMILVFQPALDYLQTASWNSRTLDSVFTRYYPEYLNEKALLDTPMTTIDGLFLPIYAEDVASLPPQIAYYNIQSYWMGGDFWNDPALLKQHQNYIQKGLIFTADYWTEPNLQKFQFFSQQYQKAYLKSPVRESVFGYSLMSLISDLIRHGTYDRDDFTERFNAGIEWNGLHNRILFPKGIRKNTFVHLIEFQNNQLRKIN